MLQKHSSTIKDQDSQGDEAYQSKTRDSYLNNKYSVLARSVHQSGEKSTMYDSSHHQFRRVLYPVTNKQNRSYDASFLVMSSANTCAFLDAPRGELNSLCFQRSESEHV